MKIVGFLGGYDKLDLILYIARILTIAKKKVLLIDSTTNQKAKYIVPSISPTKKYVTEFEGFDVAIGFHDLEGIKQYLGVDDIKKEYDIVLIDIDSFEAIQSFKASNNYKNLFVTAFDLYSLKKGLEIIGEFTNNINLTKVLFSKDMDEEENNYLDYLSSGYKVNWDNIIFNFPIELGNYAVTVENQIVSRIKIKGLSSQYKDSLQYLIETIFSEDVSSKEISKIMKNLERET